MLNNNYDRVSKLYAGFHAYRNYFELFEQRQVGREDKSAECKSFHGLGFETMSLPIPRVSKQGNTQAQTPTDGEYFLRMRSAGA